MASLQEIDSTKDREGAWFLHAHGWSVKVRPIDSPIVEEAFRAEGAAFRARAAKDTLTDEDFRVIETRVLASAVLADWRGIDQAPTYGVDKAVELLSNPGLRRFRQFVKSCAMNETEFLAKAEAAALGN